ncbi:hypothetical protein IQ243_23440 [Nostocales cyanobacterium LEGE 11386]|nr:hypothetical protein [Nostocales cyanobacterium LEGE 11386]
MSSTTIKNPSPNLSPARRSHCVARVPRVVARGVRGFETLIFSSKPGIFLPLSVSERGWGEVHQIHVNLYLTTMRSLPNSQPQTGKQHCQISHR